MEHWVHSHPSVRPCDVSEKPLELLNDMIQLSSGGFNSSVATAAPRIVAAHPGAGEALNEQHGLRNARANKRNFTTIMGEWKTLYGEVPPSRRSSCGSTGRCTACPRRGGGSCGTVGRRQATK